METLLPVHIGAGGLAILLGATALLAAKGATLHRRSGLLFVYAMVVMGFSGSILALKDGVGNANLTAGLMCSYFVVTALTTVRPPSAWGRRLDVAAMALAFALGAIDVVLGVKALSTPRRVLNGVPAPMFFILASVLIGGALGDVRVLISGARRGAQRLRRHLWRMCFALFIAAGSFFSIRARVAKVLPAPFTTPMMRTLPIVLIFAAMFYWLWRVRGRRTSVATAEA